MDPNSDNPSVGACTLEDMSNATTLESFFSTYILLDVFLSNQLIKKAKSLHVRLASRHSQEGIRQGHKLLLIAVLHNYIDEVIRSPEVIGVDPDLDYRDYWAFTRGRGRGVTRAAARTGHQISRFVARASSLVDEILTLETWDRIETLGENTKSFRRCLRRISEKAYRASRGNAHVTMIEALLQSSSTILWSTYGNPLRVAHIYTDYFIRGKDTEASVNSLDDMLEECDTLSGMTRLDFSRVGRTFVPRPLPAHWALGYVFSLHEGLKILARSDSQRSQLVSLDEMVLGTKNWRDVDKYDRTMSSIYGLPAVFSGYCYRTHLEVTDSDRRPLMAETEEFTSPERLLSLFGNRARIVERGSPGAYASFSCVLDGAIKRSKQTNEAAKVAVVVHKDNWGQEDYSAAIFMPAYGGGWISTNASMWWVFFAIGNNHSGTASANMRQVLAKLKRSRKSIDLIVVQASREEFYRYCEDPGYLRLNDAILITNKITADVRGVFPELLLANMLTNMGYTRVLNRFRPGILKSVDGEFDTVGIKLSGDPRSRIVVFESKGQASDEDELQLEINRFSSNVIAVQRDIESFCEELKMPHCDNAEIKATFVCMDTLEHIKHISIPDNVELWNLDDLVSRLKRHGVPGMYLDLLKTLRVAVII